MPLASRLLRPLQRRCAQCRRVQEVRLPALYHVVVPNKGGGTRRDGAYDCRFCGTPNEIPASALPQGLLVELPSRSALIAAAAAPSPADPAPPAAVAAPDPPSLAPSGPTPSGPAPSRAAKRTPPPAWIVGGMARTTLETAFARTAARRGDICTAFLRDEQGAPRLIDPRGSVTDGDILDWLDRHDCELLVLGGTGTDGSRWKLVFHPFAGAATLAVEPPRA